MGGEGSMMAANNSLKNNRSLLSKRKEKNSLSGSYANVQMAGFPKATPQGLKRIRERIQNERKQVRRKQLVVLTVIMLVLVSVFVYYL